MTNILESDIQKDAYHYAISRGWFAEKIMKARRKGFPDYIYLRKGRVIFIEFKRSPTEEPNIQQLKRHKEMREHGATVYVVGSLDEAKKILY